MPWPFAAWLKTALKLLLDDAGKKRGAEVLSPVDARCFSKTEANWIAIATICLTSLGLI